MEASEGRSMLERFPQYIYALTMLFFIEGAANTFGYWILFPINIFDYMGLVDIAKSSASSVMISLFVIFAHMTLTLFTHQFTSELVPVQHHSIIKYLVKNKAWLVSFFILMLFYFFILMQRWPWLVLEYEATIYIIFFMAFITAVLTYIFMIENGFADRLNTRRYMVGCMIILLVTSIPMAFGFGFSKATNIINGIKFNYVASDFNMAEEDIMKSDRYLGYYSGKYITWSPSQKMVQVVAGNGSLNIKEY
ncbi:hypothetical protein [Aeromonas aquatica]|uniref:hypothetical protein n=1 Tax=Aeromonas aquatica TaxID=558964 RepID=UPI00286ED311|nr:hypothetical protein [Aeromonas aquatica]